MIDDETSIFDKENTPFLIISLIEIITIIGIIILSLNM